jgi:hypothetical protein
MPQKTRFEGVSFNDIPVVEMNPDIAQLCRGFKCKRPEFQSYIGGNLIKTESDCILSKCFIVHYDGHLAGYITLLADKLTLKDQILLNEGVTRSTFPAIKIGWLAGDRRVKGIGGKLIKWAMEYVALNVSDKIGARFLTVDALYDADIDPHYDMSAYYANYGFEYASEEEELPPIDGFRSMYFDLMPLITGLRDREA